MTQSIVERYMSERLITISIKSTVEDIAKLMDHNNVSSVIITDGNEEIIGIFTERDIVRIISRNLPPNKIITISPPLAYVDADASMEQAAETMMKAQVRHLLVRDPHSKEMIGILSNTDLVRYLRNQSITKEFDPIWEAAGLELLNY